MSAEREVLENGPQTKERIKKVNGKVIVGFVYLSHSDMDPSYDKIGFTTRNVEKRRQELSTGCKTKPHKMLAWVPSMNARQDEKEVHQAFIDFRFQPAVGQEKAKEFFSVCQRSNIIAYFRDVLYPRFVREFKTVLMEIPNRQYRQLELFNTDLQLVEIPYKTDKGFILPMLVEDSSDEIVFRDFFDFDICDEEVDFFYSCRPDNSSDKYYTTAYKLLHFTMIQQNEQNAQMSYDLQFIKETVNSTDFSKMSPLDMRAFVDKVGKSMLEDEVIKMLEEIQKNDLKETLKINEKKANLDFIGVILQDKKLTREWEEEELKIERQQMSQLEEKKLLFVEKIKNATEELTFASKTIPESEELTYIFEKLISSTKQKEILMKQGKSFIQNLQILVKERKILEKEKQILEIQQEIIEFLESNPQEMRPEWMQEQPAAKRQKHSEPFSSHPKDSAYNSDTSTSVYLSAAAKTSD